MQFYFFITEAVIIASLPVITSFHSISKRTFYTLAQGV
jgi:hypothetical protein